MRSRLEDFAPLWTERATDYVLIHVIDQGAAVPSNCVIFEKRKGTLVIDDDALALEVKTRMHAAGVPIMSAIGPLPTPALPSSPVTLGNYNWQQNGTWYCVQLGSPTTGLPMVIDYPGYQTPFTNWSHVEVQAAALSNLNNISFASVPINYPHVCGICKGNVSRSLLPGQTLVIIPSNPSQIVVFSNPPGKMLEERTENVWHLTFVFDNLEYHHLSREEILKLLQQEWEKEFNGLIIGQDVNRIGRLIVLFYHEAGFVNYEDFENHLQWVSFDINQFNAPDWDRLVRISPTNVDDFTFRKCSIISKEGAWSILTDYLNTGKISGLYLPGDDGKPIVSPAEVERLLGSHRQGFNWQRTQ